MSRPQFYSSTSTAQNSVHVLPQLSLVWVKSRAAPFTRLPLRVLRTTCSFLSPTLMLAIATRDAYIYNLALEQHRFMYMKMGVQHGGVTCMVSERIAYYMGGWPQEKSAYSIDLYTSKVVPVREMITGRHLPGVAFAHGFVYIFSGFSFGEVLTKCERMDASTNDWEALPDWINPSKNSFSPCVLDWDIYLPHLSGGSNMDAFNIITQCFRKTPVLLPPFIDSSIAFLRDDELTIVGSTGFMARWRVLLDTRFRVEKIDKVLATELTICTPVVRIGNWAYWVTDEDLRLKKFNILTNKLEVDR